MPPSVKRRLANATPDASENFIPSAHAGNAREAWAARIEIARKSGHPEDIEVLADEARSPALRASARTLAEEILHHRDPRKSPGKVFLFSGHMIDTPDRPVPRFPPDKENLAADRIGEALDGLGAGPNDLAIAQGLDRLRFICPWNGDGAGGTAHMVKEVTRRTNQVTWLDTRELW
jgi:hypothetical protein